MLIFGNLILLSSCVTAKYNNPFKTVDYGERKIIQDEEILTKISDSDRSKDFSPVQTILETSLVAPGLTSGDDYLALVIDSDGKICASFDRTMLGHLIGDIFVSKLNWKDIIPTEGFRIGYSVYKFTDGYFWVHQVIQTIPNSSSILLEMSPQGAQMYGYSNPIF